MRTCGFEVAWGRLQYEVVFVVNLRVARWFNRVDKTVMWKFHFSFWQKGISCQLPHCKLPERPLLRWSRKKGQSLQVEVDPPLSFTFNPLFIFQCSPQHCTLEGWHKVCWMKSVDSSVCHENLVSGMAGNLQTCRCTLCVTWINVNVMTW